MATRDEGKSSGTKRGRFALSGGRFPTNTPGRRRIAPMMAKRALNRGTISKAQYRKVLRKAGRTQRTPARRNGHR